MSISVKTRKILWASSRNRCAFPGCNQLLCEKADEGRIIGEEAHIEARSTNGPRFNKTLTINMIDDFENLILLCPIHHKIIDDNPEKYTVEELRKMKHDHIYSTEHEINIEDKEFIKDYYYSIVVYIDLLLDYTNWYQWTELVLGAQPKLYKKRAEDIIKAINYIKTRIWYKEYIKLEEAIIRLQLELEKFIKMFFLHAHLSDDVYRIEQFYKIKPFNIIESEKLLSEYKKNLNDIYNAIHEMTKASNSICSYTRKYVDYKYRIAEGKLITVDGVFEYEENS